MSQALDVILLKEIGLSSIVMDGEPVHLLHVRNLRGDSATFALGQEHLSALILRAQECLTKGIEYEFEN
ncbi:hypothetical protein [Mycobacterium angelicum]|uniref:Uncharacterized protein n=1 Tax=Mycobacterium angelicum TaxID=470074 RepID=A0A1X0A282_MYCAN|nr:hypothetical protein [Mycobacterium angelicum]MCV7195400.1 hypothetical protein [Mycobacterium angelicum]ORA23836.1 hypothetical protein BST12_06680 [Mycobacterium angelicum]